MICGTKAVVYPNILRISGFGWLVDKEAPIKIAINGAVEPVNIYSSDSVQCFINGVIGLLVDQILMSNRKLQVTSELA